MGPRGREGGPFQTLTIFRRAFAKVLYKRKEISDAAMQRRGRRQTWRIPHPRTEGRTGGGGRTGDGAITPSSSPSPSSSSSSSSSSLEQTSCALLPLLLRPLLQTFLRQNEGKKRGQGTGGEKRLFLFMFLYLAHRTLPAVMSERTCPKYYWPPPPAPCYPSFPSASAAERTYDV